mmetsp:Transcript_13571/g.43784  ORF Transcript_13571/g.43784 Transcript_13571/m.43784 type:complete len:136 (+) Transcript_13571:102-509(+)
MAAYSPLSAIKASCVPRSATSPSLSTRIASHLAMVPRRWAMVTAVRVSLSAVSASWMSASVRESKADVASSRMTTGGFFTKRRAMATRCFSPPESLSPRSPTTVSQDSSRLLTKGSSDARPAASSRSSSVAPRFP